MVKRRKIKFTIPEYREKKPSYLKMGYEEIDYQEKGIYTVVTLEINESREHYHELRKVEKCLTKKGPTFLPIILLVIGAFILLAIFTVYAARSLRDNADFDLTGNALAFLIPAGVLLLADVIYTSFYFKINQQLAERFNPTKEEFDAMVDKIKNS